LVAITFDDGYYDFYSKAYPILRRFRTPCSIFPITGLLDSGGIKWEDVLAYLVNTTMKESLTLHVEGETRTYGLSSRRKRIECVRSLNSSLLKMNAAERQRILSEIENQSERSLGLAERTMLSWNEIQELKQDNVISFGCHTHTHCNLPEVSQETAELEISKSKEEMEHFLNYPVQFFSYPFGGRRNFNERIEQILRNRGFSLAVTTIRGSVSRKSNPFELRRIAAVNDASYKFKCSLVGITLQRS
jgi:peptidoglycan/xylan/chitin deacetylase (PgdA/CDA1 family)